MVQFAMKKIGVIAGSFDPITNGHAWLMTQGARLVDELHIVMGVNPEKRYWFTEAERRKMLNDVVKDLDAQDPNRRYRAGSTPAHVHFLKKDLLIHFCAGLGATHLIRGVRNAADFSYESQMASINFKIDPSVQTVYLSPPAALCDVSSATVRGFVGCTGWEDVVKDYVHPVVLTAMAKKHARIGNT